MKGNGHETDIIVTLTLINTLLRLKLRRACWELPDVIKEHVEVSPDLTDVKLTG